MKKVLITGGSRGIGAACVCAFANAGYKVYFTYKSSIDRAVSLMGQTGAEAVRADVSSAEEMKRAAEIIGGVDIIVNNAGISQIKMFQNISEMDWDNMFDINIKGMFLTVKAFLPHMISRKYGRIINVSSMWGETGGSCEVHYSASKAAVIGFTKALAKELGLSGITVNCVSPGVIETEMNAHLSDDEMELLKDETPMGRIGTAEEIADMILHLADEKSGFITGAVIPVNGGIVI